MSLSYPDTRLLIDGQWCDAADGKTLAVLNPFNEEPFGPMAALPCGAVKDSGHGSEGGPEALEADLVTKTVSVFCG